MNQKPKPILVTFDNPDAACRFIDGILAIENGKWINIHLAGKELKDFAEKYTSKKVSENPLNYTV